MQQTTQVRWTEVSFSWYKHFRITHIPWQVPNLSALICLIWHSKDFFQEGPSHWSPTASSGLDDPARFQPIVSPPTHNYKLHSIYKWTGTNYFPKNTLSCPQSTRRPEARSWTFHVNNSSWAILRQRFTTLLALIQAHSHRTTPRYEEEMESKIRSFLVRFPSLFPPGSAGQSVGLCRWPLLSWHRSFLADVVYMGCYIEQCYHRGKRRRTQQQWHEESPRISSDSSGLWTWRNWTNRVHERKLNEVKH